jgi:hypothetical protein
VRTSSPASRVVCLLAAISLVAGGGCTRTRVHTFAAYQPGGLARLDRTPDVGSYKIKYTAAGDEELKTLRGSKRELGAGQAIGFEVGADGQLIAVAGEERFPALLPPDARFAAWYSKTEERTAFASNISDLANTALPVLAVGGLAAAVLVTAVLDDDDCRHGKDRDDCRRCRR